MICECWLITNKVEEVLGEHPSLRHLVRKDQQFKENNIVLCGKKHKPDNGEQRKCIYWSLRGMYDTKLCRLCEVEIESGRVAVKDIC